MKLMYHFIDIGVIYSLITIDVAFTPHKSFNEDIMKLFMSKTTIYREYGENNTISFETLNVFLTSIILPSAFDA